jgi:hypothetical protein
VLKEDILKHFGVTSSDYLFTAAAKFDVLPNLIATEQHAELAGDILSHTVLIITYAAGGVVLLLVHACTLRILCRCGPAVRMTLTHTPSL